MAESTRQPISSEELTSIAKGACDQTLATADSYVHSQTESWNNSIISTIIQSLPGTSNESTDSQYKYAVQSTIVQHIDTPSSTATGTATGTATTDAGTSILDADDDDSTTEKANGTSTGSQPPRGRRGLHAATGAFWNEETDGMWSYKWEGGARCGMDVVINVIWMGRE
ncbi:MAG: hypothetical protein M1831_003333 [Alyxoria varia]|nr:MAG: hypothetical protein M1831_003333 [Alyxoria varia]